MFDDSKEDCERGEEKASKSRDLSRGSSRPSGISLTLLLTHLVRAFASQATCKFQSALQVTIMSKVLTEKQIKSEREIVSYTRVGQSWNFPSYFLAHLVTHPLFNILSSLPFSIKRLQKVRL